MSNDIKYTFVYLEKESGENAQKRVYALAENITAKYQLRYYYMQGYTRQHKKILDVFNEGDSPLDQGLDQDRQFKKNKSRSLVENIFKNQFVHHSKEIILDREILDPADLKDSKDTQRTLDEMVGRFEHGSYRNYILGLFYENEIGRQRNFGKAVEQYKKGFEIVFCQYCTVKLLRMNLETMELKQPTLQQNFENAFDICGYVFANYGVFYFIEQGYHCTPILYYISVMLDIFFDFRTFVYQK